MRILGAYGTMYYVSDMNEASAFFEEHLFMKPTYQSPQWTEFGLTNHRLCLHYLANGEIHPRTGILILEVEGLRDLVEEMRGNGVRFHSSINEVSTRGLSCDFFDLDGNIMTLYERT